MIGFIRSRPVRESLGGYGLRRNEFLAVLFRNRAGNGHALGLAFAEFVVVHFAGEIILLDLSII